MNLLRTIKGDYKAIPFSVKWVVFMFSVWIFGWGFADPVFALYLKSIVPDYAVIGILSSVVHFVALVFSIPTWEIEDHIDPRIILKYGLFGYFFLGFVYYFVGIFKFIPLLVFALIINGILSSMVLVSARTYVKKKSSLKRASIFAGFLNMFFFGFYGIAMFLGFYFYKFYDLHSVFLLVSFTSWIAFLWVYQIFRVEPQKSKKINFLKKIVRIEKKQNSFFQAFTNLKKSGDYLRYAFILIFFVGLVETMTMVFIPLFADEMNFSLGKISLLVGMMYLPYIFSFFFAEIADRCEKINVSIFGLILSSLTMFLMYFVTNNSFITFFSTLIAISLALINPAAEGILTVLVPSKQRGEVTGLSSFFNRMGRFIWPFVFGFFANSYGINVIFLIVAIIAFILAIFSFILKAKLNRKVDEEFEHRKPYNRIWEFLRHPLKH